MERHALLSLAVVLTAGLIGGELVARLRLPRVTGWILTGIVLGATSVPGLDPRSLGKFGPLTDFVLGYIAFTVGSHLNFRSLRNAGTRLVLLVAAEAILTPLIVSTAMGWLGGFPIEVALIFAAIAVAGAPGTTVLVVREANARGVFVKTLVAAVALFDMIAICLFVVVDTELATGVAPEGPGFVVTALPAALANLAVAGAIGLGVALFVLVMTRTIVGIKLLGASLLASILIAWGIADLFDVSSILACTFVGVALGNLMGEREHAGEAYLNDFGDILFTAFYTLAGLRLDFSYVVPMAGLVALFFASRVVGKVVSSFVSMTLARAIKPARHFLGLALLPHGGVAVGLILFTQHDPMLAEWADVILAVGLSALAINQLVGPSATRFALAAAGEVGTNRPRLLDFLREQHIATNLKADSKEHAIVQLVDLLYRTHAIKMPKDEFLRGVLERDAEESTCLGDGVMIPHGVLGPDDDNIVGVLGLSAEGLDFEAPDQRPVHAIVLLATPSAERARHLEVLAAFAKAITGDQNIRAQLYKARTPAHACALLHAESSEDFNYFLQETLDERPLAA